MQSPDGVYGFAVAGDDVYWSTGKDWSTGKGTVFASKVSCPTATLTLATDQTLAYPVLVNATDVYWPTYIAPVPSDAGKVGDAAVQLGPASGTIARCARGGCEGRPTLLESTWLPDGLGLDDGGIYSYLADGTNPASGMTYSPSIVQCLLAGCGTGPTILAPVPGVGVGGVSTWPERNFAFDRGSVFFFYAIRDVARGLQPGDLVSCSAASCSATLHRVAPRPWFWSGGGGAGLLVLSGFDAQNVYWYDGTGTTSPSFGPVSCSRSGCNAPTQLAVDPVGVPAGTNITPTGEVIVDAVSVYWLTVPAYYPWNPPLRESTLKRCSIANCASTVDVLATGLAAPYGLSQDDAYLYWAEGDGAAQGSEILYGGVPATIKRLAK